MRVNPFLFVLLGVLGFLTLQIVLPFWSYLVLGALIAYLGQGAYRWTLVRFRGRRGPAAGVVLVAALVLIIAPLGFVAYTLVVQSTEFVQHLDSAEVRAAVERGVGMTRERFGWPAPGENTTAYEDVATVLARFVREQATGWLPNAVSFLAVLITGIVLSLFIAYYGLKDGDRIHVFLRELVPLQRERFDLFRTEVDAIVTGVFLGQVAAAVAQGLLGFLAFWVLGVPNAIFWGFVMAVLSFLPIVGAFMVWAPAALFLYLDGRTVPAIGLFAWGVVVISTVDNIIKPWLISGRSQLHPALALLGVLGGLAAFGFMGFLVGPLVLALFVATLRILRDERLGVNAQASVAGAPPRAPNAGPPPGPPDGP